MLRRQLTEVMGYVLLAALLRPLTARVVGAAAIPEPDVIYYGNASISGVSAPAGTAISARIGGDVLATYILASDARAGQFYVLRLRVVRSTSPSDPRPLGHVRMGDDVSLYVNERLAQDGPVGGEATVTRQDLNTNGGPTAPPTFTPTVTPAPVVTYTAIRTTTPTTAASIPTGTPSNPRAITSTPTKTTTIATTPSPTQTRTLMPTATVTVRPSTTATRTPTIGSTARTGTPTPTQTPLFCVGDCNGDGAVRANELTAIIARIVACGGAPTTRCRVPGFTVDTPACSNGDGNGNGVITAGELTRAIFNVTVGCR